MYGSNIYGSELLSPSRSFECEVKVGTHTYTNNDVVSIDLDGDLQANGSYTIGNAISQSCDIVFRNNGNVVIDSDSITVGIWFILNGAKVQYFPLGVFNVDDYNQNDFTITVKCFDNMIKFEDKFEVPSSIAGTTTDTVSLLNAVLAQTGISFSYPIPSAIPMLVPTKEYTCRQIVGYIASALGLNAIITRDGRLKFIGLTSSGLEVTTSNYFKFDLDKNIFTIKKLTCTVADKELTLGSTTDSTMELKIDNPLMTDEGMQNAFNIISTISFMGYSSKWQGQPALDLGDIVTITDTKGVSRNVPILSQKLKYNGGLVSDIGAKGENKIANSYKTYSGQYYTNKNFEMDLGNLKNNISTLNFDVGNLKTDTADLKQKELFSYYGTSGNLVYNGDFSIYEDTKISMDTGQLDPNGTLMKAFRRWLSLGGLWPVGAKYGLYTQGVTTSGHTYLKFVGNGSSSASVGIQQTFDFPYSCDTALLSYDSGNDWYVTDSTSYPTSPTSVVCIDSNGTETVATLKARGGQGTYGPIWFLLNIPSGTVKIRLELITEGWNIDNVCFSTASSSNSLYKPNYSKQIDWKNINDPPTLGGNPLAGNLELDNSLTFNNKELAVNKWVGTTAEYNALTTKDPKCVYYITDDNDPTSLVKASATNGNIVIDGVETKVYDTPSKNVLYTDYDYADLEESDSSSPFYGRYVFKVKKSNMNNLIIIDYFYPQGYYLVFTNEVRAIDEGHIYYILFKTRYGGYTGTAGGADFGLLKITDENGVEISEITDNISKANEGDLYSIQKINGAYNVLLVSTTNYLNMKYIPNLYSGVDYDGIKSKKVIMKNCKELRADNSLAIGQYNTDDAAEGTGNDKIFVIGNGASDTARSNSFEILENGKINIFNDIIIKAGTALKTVAKTVQGAINEIFDFAMPVYKTTVTLHCKAGDLNAGTSVVHNLGYRPSRVEGYFHGGDINGTHNLDYIYQPSFIFFSHTDNITDGMYTITQVGVSEVDIAVFVQRYSIEINQARDYVIDVYLYK